MFWVSGTLQSNIFSNRVCTPIQHCWILDIYSNHIVVSLLSHVRLFMTPWIRACQALLSSTASRSWVKFMLVASIALSNHLVLCYPLLLLPSHFPNIRVFSRESSLLITWPKYWSLSFRICNSSEHSGLISQISKYQSCRLSPIVLACGASSTTSHPLCPVHGHEPPMKRRKNNVLFTLPTESLFC